MQGLLDMRRAHLNAWRSAEGGTSEREYAEIAFHRCDSEVAEEAEREEQRVAASLLALETLDSSHALFVEGKAYPVIGSDEHEIIVRDGAEAGYVPWRFVRAAVRGGATIVEARPDKEEG